MNIFWVVVFRVAVIAALQASTITKAIVAPIKQFGDSVWSLVSKAPTYAPVFAGHSAAELWSAWSTFKWNIESYYSSKGWKLWKSFSDALWFKESEVRKHINELKNNFNKSKMTPSNIKSIIEPIIRDLWRKDITKFDFEDIIKTLIEKWVLDKDNASKISYNNRLSPELIWKQVFDALTKGIKNNSNWRLDHQNDLIDLYRTWSINQVEWVWDNSIHTWLTKDDFKKLIKTDGWIERWSDIKIQIDNKSKYWKWDIASLDKNWSWGKIISVNFNITDENAKRFVWDDLKEAIELFWKLWVDEKWFSEILEQLKFKHFKDLAKQVKEEYYKRNK